MGIDVFICFFFTLAKIIKLIALIEETYLYSNGPFLTSP